MTTNNTDIAITAARLAAEAYAELPEEAKQATIKACWSMIAKDIPHAPAFDEIALEFVVRNEQNTEPRILLVAVLLSGGEETGIIELKQYACKEPTS